LDGTPIFNVAVPIVIESALAGDVELALSLTVTLKLNGLPVAVVGVPLMTPVAALSVSPVGRDPLVTVQLLYGGAPPVAASAWE
jgi:hypothetical protein